MKITRGILVALLVSVVACKDITSSYNIPNHDNPSIDQLTGNPTPSVIAATAQGLFESMRSETEAQINEPAHFGREGYYLAAARTVLNEFDDPLTPSSTGNTGWNTAYSGIRTINSLVHALDVVSGMSDSDKAAVRGFAETLEAYLLHSQLRIHDTFGIPIDTDRDPNGPLAAIASKADAFKYIADRLDAAVADLQQAGAAFPFNLPPGFAGFDTPDKFIEFNRALRARVAVEMQDYQGALQALSSSFLEPDGNLDLGVYDSYSTAGGDRTNPYYDPVGLKYLADTMIVVDAQRKANGDIDDRVTRKVAQVPYITHTGVTSDLQWKWISTPTTPLPVIRNEELILIRAEARMFTGDRAGAIDDLNRIRVRSGGLVPLSGDPGDPGLLDELLYNRRYSLVFEYGHRWVDLRRFGRLHDLVGPRGAGDRVFDKVPFPASECDARNNKPAGCGQVNGFRTTS